jgi:predicted nuclease of restriction endonuclease-like (RecB) superfamily
LLYVLDSTLDFFDLQNAYLEQDVEEAILRNLENFILELGKDFAYVESQKRMIIDGKDFYLDPFLSSQIEKACGN